MTTKPTHIPRGIRNNNPGNIRRNGDPWQGLADRQGDIEFFTFKTPVYGIRALARLLINYQDKHGLRTIEQIINRWAPTNENDTAAYVRAAARRTGFEADEKLDMHSYGDLEPLVKAIIHHENGQQPYTDAEITKALVLAGVEPKPAPLHKTRTVQAGQAATIGTVGVGAIEAVQETLQPATSALMNVAPYLETAKWILLAVTLIGIAAMVWARIDDRRKGLR